MILILNVVNAILFAAFVALCVCLIFSSIRLKNSLERGTVAEAGNRTFDWPKSWFGRAGLGKGLSRRSLPSKEYEKLFASRSLSNNLVSEMFEVSNFEPNVEIREHRKEIFTGQRNSIREPLAA